MYRRDIEMRIQRPYPLFVHACFMTKRVLAVALLLAYGALLIKVMVFKSVPTLHVGVLRLNFSGTDGGHPANFVPFRTIGPYLSGSDGLIIGGINLVGNVIFLVPVGVLLPLAHVRATWKIVALAVATGLSIETLQVVLQVGIFDIDDVILNALGVIVGFWAFVLIDRWLQSRRYGNIALSFALVVAASVSAVYVVYPKDRPLVTPNAVARPQVTTASPADLCGNTNGTGEIVAIDNKAITIRRNDKYVQTLRMNDQTVIKTAAGAATVSDLKTGDRVTLVVPDRDIASTVLKCGTSTSPHP